MFFNELLGAAGRAKEDDIPIPASLASCYAVLEGHTDAVLALSVDPDSRILASGGYDRAVHLWSLPEGEHIRTLEGHNGWVNALSIGPDGSFLASGSVDRTIRLWSPRRFYYIPVSQTTVNDMDMVSDAFKAGSLDESQRNWLDFIYGLMRWNKKFDIIVEDAPKHIDVGEFDIEIEG